MKRVIYTTSKQTKRKGKKQEKGKENLDYLTTRSELHQQYNSNKYIQSQLLGLFFVQINSTYKIKKKTNNQTYKHM